MMACMFATYKIMMRLFSDLGPAAQLPFEPPAFLQKLTHRGLTGADARECSAVRACAAGGAAASAAANCGYFFDRLGGFGAGGPHAA